jgi:tRNA U38,U39,U40 pseudouridine synthase TruA
MEHPLITDADSLTIEQLQTKVTDLTKKLSWAHRSGNAFLTQQVRMALDTYQNKLRQRQQEEWEKNTKNNPDFGNKIDIS